MFRDICEDSEDRGRLQRWQVDGGREKRNEDLGEWTDYIPICSALCGLCESLWYDVRFWIAVAGRESLTTRRYHEST